jgi:Domain of unknown function (DUF4397)
MRRGNQLGFYGGALLLAFAMCGWAGCTKMSANSATPGASNEVTYLVLMNLAPYSPSTEIYLNDVKATAAVAPGSYSTSYATLKPATYDVKFKVAGGDSIRSEIPTSPYDSLKFYTLILYNDGINGPTKSLKIFDDYSAVTANSAYYRFFHLCPEAPQVDLYMNGNLVLPARTTTDVITNTSYTQFSTLTAGSYNVSVKKAGTDSVLYALPNSSFLPGNAYTIFLSGSAANATDPIGLTILKAAY